MAHLKMWHDSSEDAVTLLKMWYDFSEDVVACLKMRLIACWWVTRSDIFRVQTRRVPQNIVFHYREIGGDCVQNIVKNSVVPT
jgi:hypothetical protein